jgi:hypothetical protein
MKIKQGLSFGLALLGSAMWPATDVSGAEVSGRASTVIEWFDDAQERTIVPVFQYLQLNVRDTENNGHSFSVYGRAGTDLAGRRGGLAKSRLYHAFFENKGFYLDTLDFRLGRQFISTTAGATVMDGLRLDYGFLDNYRLTLFGGGDATFHESYNAKDAITGGEIAGFFLNRDLHLGLSYLSQWDGGRLSHELLGFNAELDLTRSIYLYNDTQYDNLSERLSYLLVGAKYYQSPAWSGRLEYLYSKPVFASTNIYSVFAVDQYQEVLGELTYNFAPGYRSFGRYTREIYQEFSDANVFELGVEKLRVRNTAGYLTGVYRSDSDGQDLRGFKANASYFWRELNLITGVGLQLDVLERQLTFFDEDPAAAETTSKRFWADVTYLISDRANLQAKVERVESHLWDYHHRGRVRLNILF